MCGNGIVKQSRAKQWQGEVQSRKAMAEPIAAWKSKGKAAHYKATFRAAKAKCGKVTIGTATVKRSISWQWLCLVRLSDATAMPCVANERLVSHSKGIAKLGLVRRSNGIVCHGIAMVKYSQVKQW